MLVAKRVADCVRPVAFLLLAVSGSTLATPVVVIDPFHFRQTGGANPGYFPVGDTLTLGASSVDPNGAAGTSGSAAQGGETIALFSRSFDIGANQFIVSRPYEAALTDAWTLTFTNGPDTTRVPTPAVGAATPAMPLATGLSATGNALAPTISWSIPAMPAGATLDNELVLVFDLNNLVTLSNGSTTLQQPNGIFASNLLGPSTTSFTLPGGVLQPGGSYMFQVALLDFRDQSTGTAFARSQARSNAYLTYAVPEPAGIALVVLGLIGVVLTNRRARRRG